MRMDPPPDRVASLGLLALVPAVAYALSRSDPVVAVAAVNVLLIVGSLTYALGGRIGPADGIKA